MERVRISLRKLRLTSRKSDPRLLVIALRGRKNRREMSLAKIQSGAVYGVDAFGVEIEVNAGHGDMGFIIIVGLPDAAACPPKPLAKGGEGVEGPGVDRPDQCREGQESAKRALEVAVSGGHNILLIGPPGEVMQYNAKLAYCPAMG